MVFHSQIRICKDAVSDNTICAEPCGYINICNKPPPNLDMLKQSLLSRVQFRSTSAMLHPGNLLTFIAPATEIQHPLERPQYVSFHHLSPYIRLVLSRSHSFSVS